MSNASLFQLDSLFQLLPSSPSNFLSLPLLPALTRSPFRGRTEISGISVKKDGEKNCSTTQVHRSRVGALCAMREKLTLLRSVL
jgi:hypothetical protein